jgi:hypothetical protein
MAKKSKYKVVLRDDSGARVTRRISVIESDEDYGRLQAHAHILEVIEKDPKEDVGYSVSEEEYAKELKDREIAEVEAERKAELDRVKREAVEEAKAELKAEKDKK